MEAAVISVKQSKTMFGFVARRCFSVKSSSRVTSVDAIKWSYTHGASNTPLLNETIPQIQLRQTEQRPDQDLFIFPKDNVRKTYQQFYYDTQKCASGLLAMGLSKGDRIGIWGPNSYEWTVTQFAAAMAGLILVNVNPAYQVRELKFALQRVGIHSLVGSRSFKTQDYYGMMVEVCPELPSSPCGHLNSESLPDFKNLFMIADEKLPGAWNFSDLYHAADSSSDKKLTDIMENMQPDEPINIQFTSGTTGNPKGASLSHHNIVNNSYFIGRRTGYHLKKHIICCVPPLYHCFGCVAGSLCAVIHGATVAFPSPSFEPLAALQTVENEKCTSLYGTPTMFIDMLNHPDFDKYSYDSLSTGIMAGAPCPTEIVKKVIDELHMKDFVIVYGTTENSPATFQSLATDPPELRANTVGHVHDHVEAKVVDHDGKVVPVGVKGELWTRGYMVMLGYWNDEEKTKEVVRQDRWYITGDQAVMNELGMVMIVGRSKDMIIRGGENIYPTEIEEFLYTHPKIQEVQVIGVPDDRMGEEVCAWIRLRSGQSATVEEIKAFCKGQISHFKIPRYIMFKGENDFPVTVTGKIQKYKMRELSKKELGLEHLLH